MKLYNAISAPTAVDASPDASRRHAVYNDTNTVIVVTNGATTANLSEDEKAAAIADNHGWEGKKYADPAGGDSYEAVVYSNIGKPTEGAKISTILSEGVVSNDTLTGNAPLVASSSFNQSAGKKEFKLPDPNPSGATKINVVGSYSGVSGTYTCTPNSDEHCSATKATKGFTLGNGTWTFKPTNADDKLMSTPDANYASYGWWLHKSADGKKYTASAFADVKGTVEVASGIIVLEGTATYTGGAAGKYALHSSTGGTNDAGHFHREGYAQCRFQQRNDLGHHRQLHGSRRKVAGLVRYAEQDGHRRHRDY